MQVYFNSRSFSLSGCNIETYLLEKSRVTSQQRGLQCLAKVYILWVCLSTGRTCFSVLLQILQFYKYNTLSINDTNYCQHLRLLTAQRWCHHFHFAGERNYHIFYRMLAGLQGEQRAACQLGQAMLWESEGGEGTQWGHTGRHGGSRGQGVRLDSPIPIYSVPLCIVRALTYVASPHIICSLSLMCFLGAGLAVHLPQRRHHQ